MAETSSRAPLRILLSNEAATTLTPLIDETLVARRWVHVKPDDADVDCDIAFVSRDVTGLSTKHEIKPSTRVFYDALLAAKSLSWVHIHSAGTDRPVYQALIVRGVRVTTSSGANASVVAASAISGLLALARGLPAIITAQRERRWALPLDTGRPRDLEGQVAVVVGWGPIGQRIGALAQALGLSLAVVRHSAAPAEGAARTVRYAELRTLLPRADWVVLCSPLTDETRRLIDGDALALLPRHAHLINVARGDIVDEDALIAALWNGALAGAYLDVFAHEPLPADSPLWAMQNVIVSPHSAGLSDRIEERQARMFLDHLRRIHGSRMDG